MSPTATPPSDSDPKTVQGPAAWGSLVDSALRNRHDVISDPTWHLNSGDLQPQVLCRYAAGRVTHSERREMEAFLTRAPWAMSRVTALVRGARPGNDPLAVRILDATQNGDINPYRVLAQTMLHELDESQLADALERQDTQPIEDLTTTPLVRAACLMGQLKLEAAREAFGQLEGSDGRLAQLAGRIVTLDEEDVALVELLSAV